MSFEESPGKDYETNSDDDDDDGGGEDVVVVVDDEEFVVVVDDNRVVEKPGDNQAKLGEALRELPGRSYFLDEVGGGNPVGQIVEVPGS